MLDTAILHFKFLLKLTVIRHKHNCNVSTTSTVFRNFCDYGKYQIDRVACSSTLEHGLSGFLVVALFMKRCTSTSCLVPIAFKLTDSLE